MKLIVDIGFLEWREQKGTDQEVDFCYCLEYNANKRELVRKLTVGVFLSKV